MAATATDSKPGTNWKQVTPANRRKVNSLVEHYRKKPRPFDACVADNTKRFGKERAERICAVVKDMGERSTKWRNSGKLAEATDVVFDEVLAPVLDAAGVTVDELAGWVEDAQAAGLLVEAGAAVEDLTDEQLGEASAGAKARLAMLERLDLPTTGATAQRDTALVEAAADRLSLSRSRLMRRESQDRRQASGKHDEAKHPRGAGGKWIAKGASGREVRAVQRRVGARVDGDFGDKTKAAVERYQRKHGLTVDGIVGRQTLAALRGRKDAKRVKVGKLTGADRDFLRGHVKREGRKRVVEAVAVGSLLQRVRDLEPGELARLPDGGAVKHHFTEDGREVWSAGRPVSWNEERLSFDQAQRTPERAVRDALTASASRDDPESLGGPVRFHTYSSVTVNGRAAHFRSVNEHGQPLVRYEDGIEPVAVSWASIVKAERLVEASDRSKGGEPTHRHKARSHRKDKGKGAAKSAAKGAAQASSGPKTGRTPDGTEVRLRKESTGAWVVEKKSGSSWLPNRFNRDDAGKQAAEKHFRALTEGGQKAAAKEQGERMGLGSQSSVTYSDKATGRQIEVFADAGGGYRVRDVKSGIERRVPTLDKLTERYPGLDLESVRKLRKTASRRPTAPMPRERKLPKDWGMPYG